MNILALILLAALSCGIVAVSLRLHAGLARQRGLRSESPTDWAMRSGATQPLEW
ncbi:MAG TPA: hypothetical protein VJ464_09680 [Blastocatellia bacterium]|nr:hypothetical protein [Blastocatellia bacterium]